MGSLHGFGRGDGNARLRLGDRDVHRLLKEGRRHIDHAVHRRDARIHRDEQPVLLPGDAPGRVVAHRPGDGDAAALLLQGDDAPDLRLLLRLLAVGLPAERLGRGLQRKQQAALFLCRVDGHFLAVNQQR